MPKALLNTVDWPRHYDVDKRNEVAPFLLTTNNDMTCIFFQLAWVSRSRSEYAPLKVQVFHFNAALMGRAIIRVSTRHNVNSSRASYELPCLSPEDLRAIFRSICYSRTSGYRMLQSNLASSKR